MTVRNVRLLVLVAVVTALIGIVFVRNHSTASASSLDIKGISAAQFADHSITLTAPTDDPAASAAEADASAQKVFGQPVLDTQLADCTQGDSPITQDRLCWVVVLDPKGDEITAVGPLPLTTNPPHPSYPVDYEYALIDAKTGDMIIAVQHAPTDGGTNSTEATTGTS
jgi:hypothetical protein